MEKRGQSIIENFILLTLVLGLTLPLLFYASEKAGKSFRLNQAEDSMKDAAITANAISSLGRGNLNVVAISVPTGIKDSYSQENSLVYVFEDGTEVKAELEQEIIGSMPKKSGIQNLRVLSLGDGKVKIGNGPYIYTLGPTCAVYPLIGADRGAIVGTDFDADATLYVNGLPTPYDYGVTNPELILFSYGEGKYPGLTNGTWYYFQVKNPDGQFSNTVDNSVFFEGCSL